MEENEIKEHIRNEFKNLYTTELKLSTRTLDVFKLFCCFLIMEDRAKIDYDVTIEEIRSCL